MSKFNVQKVFSRTIIKTDGCLEWQGARSKAGYGQIYLDGKLLYTHRVIATFYHGEPQVGQEVLHACDNRICCSPAHLSWGTRKENMQDAIQRNRLSGRRVNTGEKHHQSKLTKQQVETVRKLRSEGWILKDLAAVYGISITAIHNIVTGRTRKNG